MSMTTARNLFDPLALKVWSRDAILRARPPVVWRRFAEEKIDLMSVPGNEVIFRVLGGFPNAKQLKNETDKLPTYKRENGEVGIKVYPMGIATENSEFSVDFSNRNEIADNALMFAINYGESVDALVRSSFLSGTNVLYANGKPNRAALTATDKLTVKDLTDARKILKRFDKNTPPFVRDGVEHYVFAGSTEQISDLKDDPDWREAHTYTIPGVTQLYSGEFGMLHGIVCVEANVDQLVGTNNLPINQGVLFGRYAVGFAIAREFEMRADPPADLGTKIRTGWVAVNGSGILSDDYMIRLESA